MPERASFLRRALVQPLSWLRFALIWPAVTAWRRKTRTRLAWRLAGSHFAIVLWSVIAISIVVFALAAYAVRQAVPEGGESTLEAYEVALLIRDVNERAPLSEAETNALLKSLTSGAINWNQFRHSTHITATVGPQMAHIRSISLIGADGTIVASSDPELIGRTPETIDPVVATLAPLAAAGSDDLDELGGIRADGDGVVGVYRVEPTNALPNGGVVVIDKFERSLPRSIWGMAKLGLVFVGQIAIVLLVLVGLPAIPIAIVVGIRRARAISRPISELAIAGQHLTDGDLSARVAEIKGQDEVAQLQHGFNVMAESFQGLVATEAQQRSLAEHALAANRDLIANVSHELRTPVALIRGHLEALEADPAEHEHAVRIALRETERLERLVDELFELSRLESRQTNLEIAPFDAGSTVRAVAEALTHTVRREAGISLSIDIGPGDLRCLGDRLRFEQVLLNLVRNAVRYTPEGGIILISAVTRGDHVDVVVRDTGIGIAPDDLPHIFDRFYRADQSRARSTGGAGLGLAIAHELVEAMGGRIAVESRLDEGTAFTITVPAAPPTGNGVALEASALRA